MALFLEDTQTVTKKQIIIPNNAKKVFKAMKKIYEPYLNKPIQGAKILKSLASDKTYNKRGNKASLNGKEKQDTVSFEDAKKRLQRQEKLSPNSLQYQLYGGELAHNILKRGVESARAVNKVDKVKPPKPTVQSPQKPNKDSRKEIKVANGKITTNESKRHLREDYEGFYDIMEEYGATYVFDSFLNNKEGKQDWTPLINPDMYVKALREFTQYGRLIKFPTKYIYQWMGIIMRNTATLIANTEICGHSSNFPYEDFEDFLGSYYNDGRNISVSLNHTVTMEITPQEAMSMCQGLNEGVDKYGQTYFPWMSQDDINRSVEAQERQRNMAKISQMYGNLPSMIEKYNDENNSEYNVDCLEISPKNGKILWKVDMFELIYKIGLMDWMVMPDGSDAISDFGIDPLLKLIAEYDDDMEAEKVLVLVNKCLDITHCRGDLSSIFIQGGAKVLSSISEEVKTMMNGKKIYITEGQMWNIINKHREESKQRDIDTLHEYPHYFAQFVNKWEIDGIYDKPLKMRQLNNYCNEIFYLIRDNNRNENEISHLKNELANFIINTEPLNYYIHRYVEDYILPLKQKQNTIDKVKHNQTFTKDDFTDFNWYEGNTRDMKLKTFLEK